MLSVVVFVKKDKGPRYLDFMLPLIQAALPISEALFSCNYCGQRFYCAQS